VKITSRQNSKIKQVAKLKQKKYRDLEQKMLVEGYYPLSFAIRNHYPLEELFVCPELLRDNFDNQTLVENIRRTRTPVTEVEKHIFLKIAGADNPAGLIAVAPQKHLHLKHHRFVTNGVYVVAESIEKPGNLGAIFRLADNIGAAGVVVTDMRADMFDPETIRVSLGSCFSVSILESTTEEAIEWFRQNRTKILATSPNEGVNYTKIDMTRAIAVVFGTEHAGLSRSWLNSADVKVKIPMLGQVNSLSVTSAAAVILYEAVRQRRIY
jgi:TrmH family RNA methyltransferase